MPPAPPPSRTADSTIYALNGTILRDHVRAPRRTAAFIAARIRTSVIVEDWTNTARYRVTRTGRIRPAPRDWAPASILEPERSLRTMRADPRRYARQLALHRLAVAERARSRVAIRALRRRDAHRRAIASAFYS